MRNAPGPESRINPLSPAPGGLATAAIVSWGSRRIAKAQGSGGFNVIRESRGRLLCIDPHPAFGRLLPVGEGRRHSMTAAPHLLRRRRDVVGGVVDEEAV